MAVIQRLIHNPRDPCRSAMEPTLSDLPEDEEKEIQELKVENPCVLENFVKEVKKVIETEEEADELIHKPPRFFRRSLIHKALKLIGNEKDKKTPKVKRPLKQNLIWLSFMITGFILAFSITDKAWQRFQLNPMFTSLILTHNEMQMFYPTVTVCPENSADETKISEFIQKLSPAENQTEEIKSFLRAIPNFSFGRKGLRSVVLSDLGKKIFEKLQNIEVRSLAFKLTKSCNKVFKQKCKFKHGLINCCDVFRPVYGEHGFCYAFNAKFTATAKSDRIINTNFFTVNEIDDSMLLSFDLQTPATIFLNSVDETLSFEQIPLFKLELNMLSEALISMQTTKTDKNAKDLSIKQRQCIFSDDVQLKYSKEPYSFSGCMRECKTDRAVELCGCLPPFYMTGNSTPCDFESLKCLKDEKIVDIGKCMHCELSCDYAVFTVDKLTTMHKPNSEDNGLSEFSMNFNHYPLIYQREVRFGFTEFLVAFGSILALFLGLSIMSLLELFFYILRVVASKICPKNSQSNKVSQ